jgi:predicted phosphodiesterase
LRIAAFGDVHGNLIALHAVLEDLDRQRPDAVVCLGDLAFRGPQPAECVAAIRALGIPCVHGNTDLLLLAARSPTDADAVPAACRPPEAALPWLRWHLRRLADRDLDFLASLPFAHTVEAEGERVLLVHATPQDCTSSIEPHHPREAVAARLAGLGANWLVMGHTHRMFAFRAAGVQLVGAGAVGFSLDGDRRAAYALVDTASGSITLRRVDYDVRAALDAAAAAGFCFPAEEYARALMDGDWPPVRWEERTPPPPEAGSGPGDERRTSRRPGPAVPAGGCAPSPHTARGADGHVRKGGDAVGVGQRPRVVEDDGEGAALRQAVGPAQSAEIQVDHDQGR